ncbi:hypothetical protein N7451_012296 [Penicillium sp. IBT 35674x]|nr:hypothetical protein N7451_012296 [Penicillium sp. IBT 35674x]
MTQSSLCHYGHGVQRSMSLGPWDNTSQYAPTPGYAPTPDNPSWSPTSPSDIGSINVDPISPIDYASPQQTGSQKNSLPLSNRAEDKTH